MRTLPGVKGARARAAPVSARASPPGERPRRVWSVGPRRPGPASHEPAKGPPRYWRALDGARDLPQLTRRSLQAPHPRELLTAAPRLQTLAVPRREPVGVL